MPLLPYKAIADEVYVTPDYFATLQIPLLAGRFFTQADGDGTQPAAGARQSA